MLRSRLLTGSSELPCAATRLLCLAAVLLVAACEAPKPRVSCDGVLEGTRQIVVVLADTMNSAEAEIRVYRRDDGADAPVWRRVDGPFRAVVGRSGLGWGAGFEALQHDGEPLKREGDKRSPAGFYRLGTNFGLVPQALPGHLRLVKDEHICVDDTGSPHYGKIVSRETAGAETSGEEMADIAVYKRGIVVEYPIDRANKSGSCIFFHIWSGEGEPTVGCVASSEAEIARLQRINADADTAVLIWPRSAMDRLPRCLPATTIDAITAQSNTATMETETDDG